MIIKSNLFALVCMFLPLAIFVGVSLVEDVKANWISYIESRQAGNCESGSRAWSSAIAYFISRNHAINENDKIAWENVARQLQHATHENPVASVNIELCDSIMNEIGDYDAYSHENWDCQHECDDECDDECYHECDSRCYRHDHHMINAIDTLQGYSREWSTAYEYVNRGSFLRAFNLPENLHVYADQISTTPFANANNVIADMKLREAYATRDNSSRVLPRVDFSSVMQDCDSLESLVFMATFSADQFDNYAKLSAMSLTPCVSTSLITFRRDPVRVLSYFPNIRENVREYARVNTENFRIAYAYHMVAYARDSVREHATNTLYSHDHALHARLNTYQLTEIFNLVRHNEHNVFSGLTRLTQYAMRENGMQHSIVSVNYFDCLARAIASRLHAYDASALLDVSVEENVSRFYYWRETHNQAWRMYVDGMRARYHEILHPSENVIAESEA